MITVTNVEKIKKIEDTVSLLSNYVNLYSKDLCNYIHKTNAQPKRTYHHAFGERVAVPSTASGSWPAAPRSLVPPQAGSCEKQVPSNERAALE